MATQKFQYGEKAYINAKHTKYDATNYGVYEGMEVQTRGINYSGHYYVMLPSGKVVTISSKALDKVLATTKKQQLQELISKAQDKIKATQAFIEETKAKISFMEETNSEEFDENEFKAYQTLTLIENASMSKLDKAKAIAQLINKK